MAIEKTVLSAQIPTDLYNRLHVECREREISQTDLVIAALQQVLGIEPNLVTLQAFSDLKTEVKELRQELDLLKKQFQPQVVRSPQTDVQRLRDCGLTVPEIANVLNTSEKTVLRYLGDAPHQ